MADGRGSLIAAGAAVLLPVIRLALAIAGYGGGWFVWSTLHGVQDGVRRSTVIGTLQSGPQATLIYDRHDKLTHALFEEQRMDVPLEKMSKPLVDAVLAAEDHRFYDHFGLVLSADAERRMHGFLVENPKDKHGAHRYGLAGAGLDEATERRRYARYQERYAIASEPPE